MTKRLFSFALALVMILSLGTFCIVAEDEMPEDVLIDEPGEDGIGDGAVVTLFDEPVTTTWGTKVSVLPEEGYTFKTDGQRGLAGLRMLSSTSSSMRS